MLDETTIEEEREGTGEAGAEAAGSPAKVPPYISFATLMTFLKDLKTNGLPPQIDKSVMSKMSGGAQSQMKIALRSLALMDGDKPTEKLKEIVEAYETSDFDALLLELLKQTYPYVFALDLMNATPTMLADAFKVTGAKEDVNRKCRTFFHHAAKRAGVSFGQRILTGSVPRRTNGFKRKAKTPQSTEDVNKSSSTGVTNPESDAKGKVELVDKLLEKFPSFDPNWPDDIKQKWFNSFEQFMKASKIK